MKSGRLFLNCGAEVVHGNKDIRRKFIFLSSTPFLTKIIQADFWRKQHGIRKKILNCGVESVYKNKKICQKFMFLLICADTPFLTKTIQTLYISGSFS